MSSHFGLVIKSEGVSSWSEKGEKVFSVWLSTYIYHGIKIKLQNFKYLRATVQCIEVEQVSGMNIKRWSLDK